MKLLEKLESSIERLVEGTTGSLFNQQLQPADIGRLLERAMDSGKAASVGTTLVPNLYVVSLNPADFSLMSGYASGLSRQMEAHIAREASDRGYSMISRIDVQIVEDANVRKRRPRIVATIADSTQPASPPPGPPRDPTASFRPSVQTSGTSAALRGLSGEFQGRTFIVTPGPTTIGRSIDNDIVIDSQDVSRRHARIESVGTGFRIQDLNSTNGTRVNGTAVRISDLDSNDEVSFGGQRFRIEFHGGGRS
ncbi:MAG TPA: DUF3662 and FHA domain-containing protein [Thermomicrobiales bacterium]|nr:DUF3662 and FHA domain-containing protein [Thermomicrobiales bacterium]